MTPPRSGLLSSQPNWTPSRQQQKVRAIKSRSHVVGASAGFSTPPRIRRPPQDIGTVGLGDSDKREDDQRPYWSGAPKREEKDCPLSSYKQRNTQSRHSLSPRAAVLRAVLSGMTPGMRPPSQGSTPSRTSGSPHPTQKGTKAGLLGCFREDKSPFSRARAGLRLLRLATPQRPLAARRDAPTQDSPGELQAPGSSNSLDSVGHCSSVMPGSALVPRSVRRVQRRARDRAAGGLHPQDLVPPGAMPDSVTIARSSSGQHSGDMTRTGPVEAPAGAVASERSPAPNTLASPADVAPSGDAVSGPDDQAVLVPAGVGVPGETDGVLRVVPRWASTASSGPDGQAACIDPSMSALLQYGCDDVLLCPHGVVRPDVVPETGVAGIVCVVPLEAGQMSSELIDRIAADCRTGGVPFAAIPEGSAEAKAAAAAASIRGSRVRLKVVVGGDPGRPTVRIEEWK